MKSSIRIILLNVILLIIIVGLGALGYYYIYEQNNFVTTDDATISGTIVPITAMAPGRLATWNGSVGSTFSQGQAIGEEDLGANRVAIASPIGGTIIQSSVVPGQTVAPGQPLASIADLSQLYVTANIDETDIQHVTVNDSVDVSIDAFPGQTYQGRVTHIGLATNSMFSLMPQTNASGNYTKVVQRIPVTISLTNYPGGTVPGMNATVKIHR